MKKLINTFAFVAFGITVLSCSSDSNSGPGTIADIASSNANLSTLVAALNKTGLTSTFDSAGDYTVFAPTNDKFQAFLDTNGFDNLDEVPVPLLTEILKNHVVSGSFYSDELATGYVKTLAKGSASTTNTLNMFIEVGSSVKLNGGATNGGATVVTADIEASNGVIHIVDNVIGLPTIVTHAAANPNFSILVAALSRPDQADQNFLGILGGTASSPFTVFAPTNTAFSNVSPQGLLQEFNWADLNAVPETVLEKTLKYHVLTGQNTLSTQLPSSATAVNTFLGQTFLIGTSGGAKITDYNNRVSNIVAVDVQCSNGVIHVLDKVIVPNLN